jgi:hypothetical protein
MTPTKKPLGLAFAGAALVAIVAAACTSPVVVPPDKTGKCSTLLTDCNGICSDLQTDPKNCNGCGNACKTNEVCVKGVCQFDCIDGTTKCGDRCFDLKGDSNNCGECGKKCAVGFCAAGQCVTRCEQAGLATCGPPSAADAGTDAAPADAGDAGDAGSFVTPGGCVDVRKDTSNCGACGVKCAANEACMTGVCCRTDRTLCGGVCTDIYTSKDNCGACGTKCGNDAACVAGRCVVSYSSAFTLNVASTQQQCNDWVTFRGKLTGTYSRVLLRGTSDPTGGISCGGAAANQICQGLRTATAVSVMCDGRTWATDPLFQGSIAVNTTAGLCPNPGYIVRPCILNQNWGGLNTNTCPGTSQTMTVECQE